MGRRYDPRRSAAPNKPSSCASCCHTAHRAECLTHVFVECTCPRIGVIFGPCQANFTDFEGLEKILRLWVQPLERMVRHLVRSEPVSACFPCLTGKIQGKCRFLAAVRGSAHAKVSDFRHSRGQIPCAHNREITGAYQGTKFAITGIAGRFIRVATTFYQPPALAVSPNVRLPSSSVRSRTARQPSA